MNVSICIAQYRALVLGPFMLLTPDGIDITPKSQKAKAILAMLIMSDRGVHSRVWLCDKLWSDRSHGQATASLRQALTEIRKALGTHKENLITTDKFKVTINRDKIDVDADAIRYPSKSDLTTDIQDRLQADFLEGLDVRDNEFEEWLTTARSYWSELQAEFLIRTQRNLRKTGAFDAAGTTMASHNSLETPVTENQPLQFSGPHTTPAPIGICIPSPIIKCQSLQARYIAEQITDHVCQNVMDFESVKLIDYRHNPCHPVLAHRASEEPYNSGAGAAAIFQIRAIGSGSDISIQLSLVKLPSNEIAWMSRFKVSSQSQDTTINADIVSQVNHATNAILKLMSHRCHLSPDSQENLPDLLLMKGIENLFRLEKAQHKEGESRLREALNMKETSQVYAWLAFASVFKLGERISEFSRSDLEETEFFARRALEIDPNNALSLSLCAHVFSFVLNDTEYASDLLDKSLKINPMHAISWDLFSVLHAYIGKPEVGLKCAKWARRIGEYSPYAYFYDASCCINAALSGRHKEAVHFGQHALSVRPNFKPPLRYMIASAGYLSDRGYTKKLVGQLLKREPDFSAREFLSSQHLRLTADQKTHLNKGFQRAGLS